MQFILGHMGKSFFVITMTSFLQDYDVLTEVTFKNHYKTLSSDC